MEISLSSLPNGLLIGHILSRHAELKLHEFRDRIELAVVSAFEAQNKEKPPSLSHLAARFIRRHNLATIIVREGETISLISRELREYIWPSSTHSELAQQAVRSLLDNLPNAFISAAKYAIAHGELVFLSRLLTHYNEASNLNTVINKLLSLPEIVCFFYPNLNLEEYLVSYEAFLPLLNPQSRKMGHFFATFNNCSTTFN